MKGIILAGGKGTRLLPLTKIINKNILPIYNQPLIFYPIITLRDAGITNILIISGPGHAGQFLDLLGTGRELGVDLSYDIQEEAKGIAHGLAIAEDFADNDKIALILGDNIFESCLKPAVLEFEKQPKGASVVLKQVPDPQRYGVPYFNKKGQIIKIIEKPKRPPHNWMVTGFYLYDNQVFDKIRKLKPSARGEYEVTDLNNLYVKEGTLAYHKTKGYWIDAGTFNALLEANIFIAKKHRINANLVKSKEKSKRKSYAS